MLAWFKKKFGKKPAEPEAVAADDGLETVAVDVPEAAVAVQPEEAATTAPAEATTEIVPEPPVEPAAPEIEAVPDEELVEAAVAEAQVAEEVEPPAPEPEVEPGIGVDEVVATEPVVEEEVLAELEPMLPVAEIDITPPTQAETEALPEAADPDLAFAPEAIEVEAVEAAAETEVMAEVQEIQETPAPAETEPAADEPVVDEITADLTEQTEEEKTAPTESMTEPTEAPAEEVDAVEVVPAQPLAEKTQEKPASKSLFGRLRERLGKTRDAFIYRLDRLFLGKKEIDQELFEQLEEVLITADLGVSTTLDLLDRARKKVKRDLLSDPQALKTIIRDEILGYIQASERPAELVMPEEGPFVIMVVGVNGVGKTTSIGKIAAKFVRSGQSVLLVAGDTFRAAAINQLRIWGERVGVEVIAQKPGADPSSVVFDGLEYGVAHNYDVILIDTAGRLHTSVNLMEELKKIRRVIGKKLPGAPHEVMLVLDATTGQNGISQAKMFHEAVGVSGLTLTKLDGTAKGGIVANVCRETGIPVRFIGIGEQIDDLRDFDAREFVDALFAQSEQ